MYFRVYVEMHPPTMMNWVWFRFQYNSNVASSPSCKYSCSLLLRRIDEMELLRMIVRVPLYR